MSTSSILNLRSSGSRDKSLLGHIPVSIGKIETLKEVVNFRMEEI